MAHADIRALDPCILEAIRTVGEMLKRRTYPKLRQTRMGRTNYQRRFRECWQQWPISIRYPAESRDSAFEIELEKRIQKSGSPPKTQNAETSMNSAKEPACSMGREGAGSWAIAHSYESARVEQK